jgi:hypothetical protein
MAVLDHKDKKEILEQLDQQDHKVILVTQVPLVVTVMLEIKVLRVNQVL